MKTVLEYIENTFLIESMKQIDADIIYEQLNCKVLLDVAKQLKSIKDIEISKKQKDIEDQIERNPDDAKYYTGNRFVKTKDGKKYKVSTNNRSFKEIFGDNRNVKFNELTDADVTIYEPDDKQHEKIIKAGIKGNANNIYILQDPKTEKYKFYINSWGYIIHLTDTNNGWYSHSHTGDSEMNRVGGRRSKWVDLKQYEKKELCKGLRIYEIDCSKADSLQLKQQRQDDRSGMIYFDEGSLKLYAEDNIKRYKKIVAQNKANRLNDDKLLNDVEAIIKKVAELAVECAKDPILNADITQVVSTLCTYIYDSRVYHSSTKYNNGYYSGVNGILPQLKKYTDNLNKLKKGGDKYDQEWFDEAKKNLEESVKKCHELLKTIDEDI